MDRFRCKLLILDVPNSDGTLWNGGGKDGKGVPCLCLCAASAASARKRKRSTLSLFLGCGRRWLDSLEGEKDVFLPGRKFAHLDICWLGWENVSLICEKC